MANARSANCYYIDTQYSTNEELAVKNVLVLGVLVTVSAAGGNLVLSDGSTVKASFKVATDEETAFFDFGNCPMLFTTSIRPSTLTDAVATVIFKDAGRGG